MRLSVILVNYNVRYFLEQCLHSVERAMNGIDGEVIVIDNHSQDNSIAYLKPRFPRVVFIDSNHNLGYARANNTAIRQCHGDYVLLLNPDTFIGEQVLTEALRFMDVHERAGGVGVMMHNPDGTRAKESRRGLPTPLVSFLKMIGRDDRYYMSHLSWDEPARIEVISGAFFLLRKKALEQVGLLDEDFFMYGEDIDLSYRLVKGGWENWYLPLKIIHYKGESTYKSSFRYVHVFYQAMLIFFRKHYSHLSLLITLPIKLAIYLRASLALVAMVYDRMRRLLGFSGRRSSNPGYLFRGSANMLEECRQLTQRKGLSEQPGTPTYVVYDTDTFSYSQIIDEIGKETGQGHVLGTYSCKTKVLITPGEVIC